MPSSEPKTRILSLLPSGTEIVCALGLENRLIGRSHECNFPETVKNLPVCSEPNVHPTGVSKEINQSVESVLKHTLSIYRVDTDAIRALRPTHIITQSQCSVCAISTSELKLALKDLLSEQEITIIDSSPMSLEGVFRNIRDIAASLNCPGQGDRLVRRMQERFESVRERAGRVDHRPSVAHIEWIEPLMTGGHWVMSMIEWAGGRNLFSDEEKRWIRFDDLQTADPDKIVVAPCGFSLQRTRQEMTALESNDGWRELKAVREGQVYLCDGSSYFNRPGPRLANSLEILGEIYHPHLFSRSHTSAAWIRFNPNRTGSDDWRNFDPEKNDSTVNKPL